MIDPKELRIGNWIKDFNDRYGLVTSFNQHRVWVRSGRLVNGYDCTLQDLYPIPLTEDILIKCGFKIDHSQQIPFIYDNHFEFYGHDGVGFGINLNSKYDIDLVNLHQLQNLYYSLTGKELEFKP